MKNKWRNYALKDGKVQSSYIREYCNRKKVRQAGEASHSDSHVQSRQEQEEIKEVKLIYKPPTTHKVGVNSAILNEAWVVNLRKQDGPVGITKEWVDNLKIKGREDEIIREENPLETHQEGRQGIQSPDQGRCEAQERDCQIKIREKEVDANNGINQETGSAQEAGRGHDTQSSSSGVRLMDVQDFPGKSNGIRRQTRRSKKHIQGSQEPK